MNPPGKIREAQKRAGGIHHQHALPVQPTKQSRRITLLNYKPPTGLI
jgi:hypothetical protein